VPRSSVTARLGRFTTVAILGLAALLAAVGTIAALTRGADQDLVRVLKAAGREHNATLDADFSALFPGDWDRMVIICRGATTSEVDGLLGFHWDGAAQVRSDAFLSAMVFVHGATVETSVSTGPDSGWVYVPCPLDLDDSAGAGRAGRAVSVERMDAVRFTHHRDVDTDFWYVDESEFSRLAAGA